jgi:hypothetical protein
MAQISKADYETVAVTCDHCGKEGVFNRREYFMTTGPYAGENVRCTFCGLEFRMMGDIINPAYELFVFAAREYFREKRYMLATAGMSQAWEVFFSTFAAARYLYRPFFLSAERDIDRLNALQSRLEEVLRKFTFAPLRNLVINTVVQAVAPQNLDEASLAIDKIGPTQLGYNPSPVVISSVADVTTRHVLEGLLALSVGDLRNRVLHRRAYRPTRAEVERCLEDEVDLLYRARQILGVRSFDELAAGLL